MGTFRKKLFSSGGNLSGDKSFIVRYHYIPDIHYKRIPYHKEHIEKVETFEKGGANIIGGSLFPNTGAYLFIQCAEKGMVEDFIKNDPFVREKLVTMWEIDEIEMQTDKSIDTLAK